MGGCAVMPETNVATWGIAALATLGVIARPWNLPEFIWAVAGAALLVLLDLLPWPDALAAAAKGTDVYFFLIGMMLLAEVARKEGSVRLARRAGGTAFARLGEAAVSDRLRRSAPSSRFFCPTMRRPWC